MKELLHFLEQLCVHNNREWFNEHKAIYQQQKLFFEEFIGKLMHEISKFDDSVKRLEPKDCTYRIYRDVRFSDDKTPYKQYIAAFIAIGGKKSFAGGYYVHIEPENTLISGGVYQPPVPVLYEIRKHIVENWEEFKSIIHNPPFASIFKNIEGDKLQSMPRGFDKNLPAAEIIKHKSFLVSSYITNTELTVSSFFEQTVEKFHLIAGFNTFFNRILHKYYS